MVLEKTPESPLDSKEIKPINFKGNQPWTFIGRIHAETEAPALWSSDVNRRLIGKVPDAGKDQRQKEKRASEDEMAGRHHWCNEHELGQTPGDGEGQWGLLCCSPWGHKESDVTGQLNNINIQFSNKECMIGERLLHPSASYSLKRTLGASVITPLAFLLWGWLFLRQRFLATSEYL